MNTSLSSEGGRLLRHLLLALAMIGFATQSASAVESPLTRLDKALTVIVQKHFPDAVIERTADRYAAKHGTMQFVVHASDKTGRFHDQTNMEEGPNYRGFLLELDLRDGPYEGAAAVPQEMKRPYWTTFVDVITDPKANQHLFIHFSFGSQLNADFKREVSAALGK